MIETILQRVTRIPLRTWCRSYDPRLGRSQSRLRGAGMEFDQLKEYQEGEPLDLEVVFIDAIMVVAALLPLLVALAFDFLPVCFVYFFSDDVEARVIARPFDRVG